VFGRLAALRRRSGSCSARHWRVSLPDTPEVDINDPHVESLEYRFVSDATRVFKNPPPLEHEGHDFKLRLDNNLVVVTLKTHYSTEAEARGVVDRFLKGWELDQALASGRRALRFEFEKAVVINRNPPKGIVLLAGTATITMTANPATLTVTSQHYPAPPTNFVASVDVESLWNRYEGHLLGREPLLSMGYFCLSAVEALHGGRKLAAEALNIDPAVLSKLGELTSTRGDALTARKQDGKSPHPLTPPEERWIADALKAIIR
jgi:hypothetical protein